MTEVIAESLADTSNRCETKRARCHIFTQREPCTSVLRLRLWVQVDGEMLLECVKVSGPPSALESEVNMSWSHESHRQNIVSAEMLESRRPSVAHRWAVYVLKGCDASCDPNTLEAWANESAVSYSTLCEICRLNAMRPLGARDFVRVLRALRNAYSNGARPVDFLSVSDRRTLRSLSQRSGLDLEQVIHEGDIVEFFGEQRFIAHDLKALRILQMSVLKILTK